MPNGLLPERKDSFGSGTSIGVYPLTLDIELSRGRPTGLFGVDPDQEVVDPVEVDWRDFFLFEEDLIVEEAVEGAEHFAAVFQLQVDPGAPAEAGIVAAISSLEGMGGA